MVFDFNPVIENGDVLGSAIIVVPEYNLYPVIGPSGIVNATAIEFIVGLPETERTGADGICGRVVTSTITGAETPPGPIQITLNAYFLFGIRFVNSIRAVPPLLFPPKRALSIRADTSLV